MSETKRPFGQRVLIFIAVTVAILGTLTVVVAAFALSYVATKEVAEAARVPAHLSWLLPSSVDGAMMVATVAVLVMRHLKKSVKYPACVVGAGATISILCNGLHATGAAGPLSLNGFERFAVSAIPPVMLALSVHLLVELLGAFLSGTGARADQRRPAGSSAGTPRRPLAPAATAASPPARPTPQPVAGNLSTAAPLRIDDRVSLAKPGARHARRGRPRRNPVEQAELVLQVGTLAEQLGRRPTRDEVKAQCHVGANTADRLLRALDAKLSHREVRTASTVTSEISGA